MDAREEALVAISKVPANSGHSLHKGTPREAFIHEFLEGHLPGNMALGTGEIIDASSTPGERRNQFDIVIYRKNYPKLDFGGRVSGFLIESVIATIEVKSLLTKKDLRDAVKAARNSKALSPSLVSGGISSGYVPPKILNYVVAYDGPANMATVYGWLNNVHSSMSIVPPVLPRTDAERLQVPSHSIDGVFVLKKGFIYFDNTPHSFATKQVREQVPNLKWVFSDTKSGNLLLLFLFVQSAIANLEGRWLDPTPYLRSFKLTDIKYGF